MRAEQINEILISGDYKKKINLYLTEVAGLNSGEDEFLTQEQRLQIVTNLKGKEIEYYNKLQEYNRTFLLYKNMIIGYVTSINYLCLKLQFIKYSENYEQILSVYMDKDFAKLYKLPSPDWLESSSSDKIMSDINNEQEELKEIIDKSRKALKKNLPLKPYLDFLKEAEKEVKDEVRKLDELLSYIKFRDSIQANANRKSGELSFIPGFLGAFGKSKRTNNGLVIYDSIIPEITEEDIKNYIIR